VVQDETRIKEYLSIILFLIGKYQFIIKILFFIGKPRMFLKKTEEKYEQIIDRIVKLDKKNEETNPDSNFNEAFKTIKNTYVTWTGTVLGIKKMKWGKTEVLWDYGYLIFGSIFQLPKISRGDKITIFGKIANCNSDNMLFTLINCQEIDQ